ncbi:MAG TPA: DUF1579 domain-containing protein [Planctomycetota bacterium]|jgi:hypothetical protein|nr:DUF1579 domain-containing protein [Planctomycetota bacterium]
MNIASFRTTLIPLICLSLLGACSSSDRANTEGILELQDGGTFTIPTPGPEHAWLATRAGHWSIASKWRMAPDAPWVEWAAEEWAEVVAGGFWVVSKQLGTFNLIPFEGRSTNGYDQVRKIYVGSWVDNFGSSLTTFEGHRDPVSGDLITWSDMMDPGLGKTMRVKMVSRYVDADHTVFEMHMPNPAGDGQFLSMVQEATRIP